MKIKLQNIKLKHFFTVIIIVATLIIVAVQTYYYFALDRLVGKEAERYFKVLTHDTDSKIQDRFFSIKERVHKLSYSTIIQQYLSNDDKFRRADIYPMVFDYMREFVTTNRDIMAVRFYDSENTYLGTSFDAMTYNITYDRVIETLQKNPSFFSDTAFFMGPYFDPVASKMVLFYVLPIYPSINGSVSVEPTVLCIAACSINYIDYLYTDFGSDYLDNTQLIFSFNDTIVSSTNTTLIGKSYRREITAKLHSHSPIMVYDNIKYMTKEVKVSEPTVNAMFMIPYKTLTKDSSAITSQGITISIILVIILLLYEFFIVRIINMQIYVLMDEITNNANTNFHHRLLPKGFSETVKIANHINNMRNELENMARNIFSTQERLYRAEIEQKNSELNALQSQINPHFLYNTLECIRSIAKYRNVDEIAEISKSMSKIFRYSIKGSEIVTIEEELAVISEYVNIMNIRSMNKYTVTFDIADEVKKCKIHRMLLQPIVENAFYHGMEQKDHPGELFINIFINDSNIVAKISDNGAGISEEKLNELRAALKVDSGFSTSVDTRGVGILNVNSRIKLYYGDGYGICIDSIIDVGTDVTVTLPTSLS